MCDNNHSSSPTLVVSAAELQSLVDAVMPVVVKLCWTITTVEFHGSLEELQELRDWVDRAYITVVELCQAAADKVDGAICDGPRSPAREPPLD